MKKFVMALAVVALCCGVSFAAVDMTAFDKALAAYKAMKQPVDNNDTTAITACRDARAAIKESARQTGLAATTKDDFVALLSDVYKKTKDVKLVDVEAPISVMNAQYQMPWVAEAIGISIPAVKAGTEERFHVGLTAVRMGCFSDAAIRKLSQDPDYWRGVLTTLSADPTSAGALNVLHIVFNRVSSTAVGVECFTLMLQTNANYEVGKAAMIVPIMGKNTYVKQAAAVYGTDREKLKACFDLIRNRLALGALDAATATDSKPYLEQLLVVYDALGIPDKVIDHG